METIVAQATPSGRSGVAIIRISGPAATRAVGGLTAAAVPPRRAVLRRLRDRSGEHIDDALIVYFPRPGSFTGEDVVEVQCHGSVAVVRQLLKLLSEAPGCRPAEPGEFTRRALENGRLDLAQVEGLADLLAAETEAQRRQAVFSASGHLSSAAERWRAALIRALAHIEASIDFSDDGVDADAVAAHESAIRRVHDEISQLLAGSVGAERVRSGFVVALCGPPNVGKSTLFNAIAGRDIAITSDLAGTTRDVLEVDLDVKGLPVRLLDTAGLREANDSIEALGIERARQRLDAADLRVVMNENGSVMLDETQMQVGNIYVSSKADRGSSGPGLQVSGLTGLGVDALLDVIATELRKRAGPSVGPANPRQRHALETTAAAVARVLHWMEDGGDHDDLIAEELRASVRGLDYLAGRVDVEEVLDIVFRDFCLGK